MRESFSSEEPGLGERSKFDFQEKGAVGTEKEIPRPVVVVWVFLYFFLPHLSNTGIIPLGLLILLHHLRLGKAVRSERKLYVPWSSFALSEASAQLRVRAVSRSSDKCLQNTLKIKPTVLITTGAMLFYHITLTAANGQEVVGRNFFFIFSSCEKTPLKPSPRCAGGVMNHSLGVMLGFSTTPCFQARGDEYCSADALPC